MTNAISFVPTPSTNAGAGAAASQASLADNFDTFLTILTAQIQNQDPLEPMDSSKFTDQLVQFSGVEQQIKSNKQLEQLLAATNTNAGAALSGYGTVPTRADHCSYAHIFDKGKALFDWTQGAACAAAEACPTRRR